MKIFDFFNFFKSRFLYQELHSWSCESLTTGES